MPSLLARLRPSVRARDRGPDPLLAEAVREVAGLEASGGRVMKAPFGGFFTLINPFKARSTMPQRGTEQMLRAYAEMPWLRAVVGKVAKSVAMTEWRAFVPASPAATQEQAMIAARKARRLSRLAPAERAKAIRKQVRAGELEEAETHPILDLLERGNEFHTGLVNMQVTQAQLDLVGDGFWLKERNARGEPTALWAIPPHWVREVPQPGGGRDFFVLQLEGHDTVVPMTEMVWFQEPDMRAPYGRGAGYARALGDELDTDEFSAKYLKQWFYNDAIPPIVVSGDGLRNADTRRLEEDWANKNQGFWQRFKPYFISRRVFIERLASSFQEMQVVELRKFERDAVINVFGVPPELLGILQNSNRATIEAADFLFARWVVVPRLELLRATMQVRLVPDYRTPGLVLDYASPVAEDKEFTLRAMQSQAHAFTADEWRELAGLEPLPDGDGEVFFLPFNVLPASDLGGAADDLSPEPEPEPEEPEDDPGDGPDMPDDGEPVEAPEQLGPRAKQDELSDALTVDRVLAALKVDDLKRQVQPVVADTIEAFGRAGIESVGLDIDFSMADPRVVEYAGTSAFNRLKDVNSATRSRLRSTLAAGLERGESINSLAGRISGVFEASRGPRSHVIARTETVRAANFGQLEGIRQAGVEEKEWLSVKDDAVRDSHQELDGQRVPIGADFQAQGGSGPHPGSLGAPEEDINCRCTVIAVIGGENGEALSLGGSEEKRVGLWKRFDRERAQFERRFRRGIRSGFDAQEAAALAALRRS